jgi:hypothetical protein
LIGYRRFPSLNDTLCHFPDRPFRTLARGTVVRVARNSTFWLGLKKPEGCRVRIWNQRLVAASKLHATFPVAAESNRYKAVKQVGGEDGHERKIHK